MRQLSLFENHQGYQNKQHFQYNRYIDKNILTVDIIRLYAPIVGKFTFRARFFDLDKDINEKEVGKDSNQLFE